MADPVRLQLWHAMSELYLDTEVRPSIPWIAHTCVETGYDDGLLEHVFWHEVNPVLYVNLMSVAGEWSGFASEWLARTLRERPYPASRLRRWMARRRPAPREDFAAVMTLARRLRQLPVSERERRVRAWGFLIGAYVGFGPHGEPGLPAPALRAVHDEDLAALLPRMLVASESRDAARARLEEALT